MLYYNCQGDRDVGRPSYGLSAVCAKATKKNKKIIENPLTLTAGLTLSNFEIYTK